MNIVQHIFKKYHISVDLMRYINSPTQKLMLTGEQFKRIAAAINDIGDVLELSEAEVKSVKDMESLLRFSSLNEPNDTEQQWVVQNANGVVMRFVQDFTFDRPFNYAHKLAVHVGPTMAKYKSVGIFSSSSTESCGAIIKKEYPHTNHKWDIEIDALRQVINRLNLRLHNHNYFTDEYLQKKELRRQKRKGYLPPEATLTPYGKVTSPTKTGISDDTSVMVDDNVVVSTVNSSQDNTQNPPL